MRLLAGVPSVVYGLIGILAIAPIINNDLISQRRKASVSYVVQLNGANLTTATLILTVMILPILVAITADSLEAVPRSWQEGSLALGVNRWRTIWRVSLRTARPAIVAATILATARALGEAVMLAMVSGGARLRRQPARRPDVLPRAGAPARRDDPPERGRAHQPARHAHDVRDRRRAARLRGDALAHGLGRQAPAQPLRDPHLMATAELAPPTAVARAPRERSGAGPWRTASHTGPAGRRASASRC